MLFKDKDKFIYRMMWGWGLFIELEFNFMILRSNRNELVKLLMKGVWLRFWLYIIFLFLMFIMF